MNKSKKLVNQAARVDFFKGSSRLSVGYITGRGYTLAVDGRTVAWFQTFAAGERWLSDLQRTGVPNYANLRAGTAFQRGVFTGSEVQS